MTVQLAAAAGLAIAAVFLHATRNPAVMWARDVRANRVRSAAAVSLLIVALVLVVGDLR